MLRLLFAAVVALVFAPTLSAAQSAPPQTAAVQPQSANQENISTAFSGFTRQNAEVVKALTETLRKLEEAAKATPESQKLDIGAFKTQLLDLALLMAPGSPLLDKIDHLESAIVAQRDDFQKLGRQLGDEAWGKKETAAFERDLGVIATSRSLIKEYNGRIDKILKDLAKAESRAAYLMMRQTHKAALDDLTLSLKRIGDLLDEAGAIIRNIGTPPTQT